MERREPLHTVEIGTATVENNTEFLQNKNRAIILSSISTPEYISRKNKNTNLKRYMHPNVHSCITYNSQDMEAT